jgi:hypothetical protein
VNYTEYARCDHTVTNTNSLITFNHHYDIYSMTQFERIIPFTAEDGIGVKSPHQLMNGGSI